MGLQTYKKKRDFSKTPEPPPSKAKRGKGFSFCVQKHDATRLHYDFRLELDGVLKSWAVTKGPSLDPADKRLAVRTEDHPLEYGGFEGIIPEGQYGGGTVMLWDRGSWTPLENPHEGLKKGHLKFELQGGRLKGKWVLVRMRNRKESEKRENWLLIKEDDGEAAKGRKAESFLDKNATSIKTGATMAEIAKGKSRVWNSKKAEKKVTPKAAKRKDSLKSLLSRYPEVQLATLVTEPPEGPDWLHEVKFDGYRILCFVSGGEVTIRTRNGHDWTESFPAIAAALSLLDVEDAVLDGEAVMLDKKGRSSFQALQHALGEGGDTSAIQAFFFDLLHLNGKDMTKLSLLDRKTALKKILPRAKAPLYYSDHLPSAEKILQKSCEMGLEGIVSKRKESSYYQGRGKSWLKSKCSLRQEFTIIGFTAGKKDHRSLGALHLGYMKDGKMTYAGKVGTGFGRTAAQEILDALKPLVTDKPHVDGISGLSKKGSTWVKPKLLCEVTFTEWTADGHIRHPSFEGLREDKSPKEVVREKPVKTEKLQKRGKNTVRKKSEADEGDALVNGITITHPDRLVFEKEGITKLNLARYYAAVAPFMLKEIAGIPVTLLRCTDGVGPSCFYQRNPDEFMKKTVKAFDFRHKGKKYEYLYVETEKQLVFLIQMGVVEIHPWGARADSIDYPRRLIFDLDPDEGVPFDAVKLAALDVRKRLKKLKLESFLKCTGGKGLHIIVPLTGKQKWAEVKEFARVFAEDMVRDVPEAYVATMTKTKRKGKIFIDFFRNDYTATAVSAYSVRARPDAPVAVPLEWEELKKLKSGNAFTIDDVLKRVKRKKPDEKIYKVRQKLPL